MSLQAIWLEGNWSMTDPIHSVSCWLIFFCCGIWHTCNCFSFFIRMCAFVLHSEYTTTCFIASSVVGHNFQSSSNKQARQTFHYFFLNSPFIQPSEWKFILFVFLSVCRTYYILVPCVSDTLARDFLSAQLIYRGKVELCHPFYDFRGKESTLFSRTLPTAKIKIRKK